MLLMLTATNTVLKRTRSGYFSNTSSQVRASGHPELLRFHLPLSVGLDHGDHPHPATPFDNCNIRSAFRANEGI